MLACRSMRRDSVAGRGPHRETRTRVVLFAARSRVGDGQVGLGVRFRLSITLRFPSFFSCRQPDAILTKSVAHGSQHVVFVGVCLGSVGRSDAPGARPLNSTSAASVLALRAPAQLLHHPKSRLFKICRLRTSAGRRDVHLASTILTSHLSSLLRLARVGPMIFAAFRAWPVSVLVCDSAAPRGVRACGRLPSIEYK